MARLDLSILDFGHAGAAVDLVAEADRLGYRRYWLGEHHSRWQCANPLLLGALLAATSEGIRIGSGGVCLDYQSPFRIAEDARLVEYLLPGRFDLGVTRGLGLPPDLRAAILDGRPAPDRQRHAERLAELHGYLTGRLPAGHPLAGQALPLSPGPPLWVLGISPESARWAARHGAGFCFSLHHAPDARQGEEILREYQGSFQPSPEFPEPAALVVVSLVWAETTAQARKEAELFAKVGMVGTAAECAERIAETADRFGVGEVMVLDLFQGMREPAVESFRTLAALAGLSPRLPAEAAGDG